MLIALGLISATFSYIQVLEYQTIYGQIARTISQSAQEQYQIFIVITIFGVFLAIGGFGITIYAATFKEEPQKKQEVFVFLEKPKESKYPIITEIKEPIPPKKIEVEARQDKRESRKLKFWIIGGVIILVLIALFFPTPHARVKTESDRDRLKTLNCSETLRDGYSIYWDLTDLHYQLEIDVNLESTEDVIVYIKSSERVVSNKQQMAHHYSVNCNGLSIYAEVKNPTMFGLGPSAVVSGDIEIFNDYQNQVTYEELLPWWMA